MFWNGNKEKLSIFIVHVPIIYSFSYRIANTKTICILVTLMCMIFFFFFFNIPSFNLLVSCYHGLSPLSMILFSLLEHALLFFAFLTVFSLCKFQADKPCLNHTYTNTKTHTQTYNTCVIKI